MPGEVEIGLTATPLLTQQHGFLHAGVLAGIADSACGYAVLSLAPEEKAGPSWPRRLGCTAGWSWRPEEMGSKIDA